MADEAEVDRIAEEMYKVCLGIKTMPFECLLPYMRDNWRRLARWHLERMMNE